MVKTSFFTSLIFQALWVVIPRIQFPWFQGFKVTGTIIYLEGPTMTSQMETTRVLSGGVASWTGAGHWKSSVPWSACGWIQNSFRILWWCCNTICTYTHLYMYTVHIKSVYTHRCPHVYRSYMLHAYAYTNIHHDIYAKKTYLLYIYEENMPLACLCSHPGLMGSIVCCSFVSLGARLALVFPSHRFPEWQALYQQGGAKSNAIFGPWRCTWGYELV